jgi:Fe2+ transport system protein FeoA
MSAAGQEELCRQVCRLLELNDGETGLIRSNSDRKSIEMGLFPGARVVMFRNRKAERSLVIGAGDARFLVSRVIAQKVEVETLQRKTSSL